MDFKTVELFEKKIAEFYGARYAVATDCCTHAVELSLRYTNAVQADSPKHTYISIPFTFEKLGIKWSFVDVKWHDYYYVTDSIIDAAVYWEKDGYIPNTFMCLSFQFKKHLGLGRGGAILLDNKKDYINLKKMSYDGRIPDTPWAEQDIDSMGYHYYMTPETAELGINRLDTAIKTTPKKWCYQDYPNLTNMKVFE